MPGCQLRSSFNKILKNSVRKKKVSCFYLDKRDREVEVKGKTCQIGYKAVETHHLRISGFFPALESGIQGEQAALLGKNSRKH